MQGLLIRPSPVKHWYVKPMLLKNALESKTFCRLAAYLPHVRSVLVTKAAQDITRFPSSNFLHSSIPISAISGSIELIVGPMFAGKSSELLKRVIHAEAGGYKVTVVKSDVDGRYSKTEVVTHDGTRRHCHAVPSLMNFRSVAGKVDYSSADVIAIDEAQFFPDLLEFCAQAADVDGKRLLVAGLDGDFKRRKFGQVLELIPLADSITKLNARCRFCEEEAVEQHEGLSVHGRPAMFSVRLKSGGHSDSEKQKLVGGTERYAPACRRHYMLFSDTEHT